MFLLNILKNNAVLLLTFIMVFGFMLIPPSFMKKWPTLLFAQAVAHEALKGHLEGQHSGRLNHVSFIYGMQPGDVIMCHNPFGAYGFWTHCAIYIGNNQAVDSEDFTNGTRIVNVRKYNQYDKVAVFRGMISDEIRNEIAKRALREVGKPYDPFSPLMDTHSEYCSKLVWRVFDESGVITCPQKSWIVPDDIANGKNVQMICAWLS